MHCHHYKLLYNQKRIGIKDRMLKLRKISRTYKKFGKLFYEVWLKIFYNYISVIVLLFAPNMAKSNIILNIFYANILQFSQVYKWQKAILPLTIKVYIYIFFSNPLIFQKGFYNSFILFGSSNS